MRGPGLRRRLRSRRRLRIIGLLLALLLALVGLCGSPASARPVVAGLQDEDDAGRSAEIDAGAGRRRRPLLRALQEPEPAAAPAAVAGPGVAYTAEALADEIAGLLPGLSAEAAAKAGRFRQFSGYLQISDYKRIFYWFVEAVAAPEAKPLVFWTNGGPGCSGLYGFMNENGPFRPSRGGKSLEANPYAWSKAANMLFVEQPVSVGFSYATSEEDNKAFGDDKAAADNYLVIQRFLERFPHLRSRELHLSGESYAGHYLPLLARYIVEKNTVAPPEDKLNLKGFLVGNPSTDPVHQLFGQVETLKAHGLLPPQVYESWLRECAGTPTLQHFESDERCLAVQRQLIKVTAAIDPYSLGTQPCDEPMLVDKAARLQHQGLLWRLAAKELQQNKAAAQQHQQEQDETGSPPLLPPPSSSPPSDAPSSHHQQHRHNQHHGRRDLFFVNQSIPDLPSAGSPPQLRYDPCAAAHAAAYLNREDVKAAIHADPSIAWRDCSTHVLDNFQRSDWGQHKEPTFKWLVEEYAALRILLYAGDQDTVCSVAGITLWLDSMQWRTKEDWTPWFLPGEQQRAAGRIRTYENGVVFVVVDGAGHEAPAFRAKESLFIFSQFLQGGLL